MNRMKKVCLLCAVFCVTQLYLLQAQSNSGKTGPTSRTTQNTWQMQPIEIKTRWAKEVSPRNVLPEYPRPQMVRQEWQNLNGLWQYVITEKDDHLPANYNDQILVPFPIESALSGVKKTLLPSQRLWYKRIISKPDINGNKRVLLHFGAVDWQATVYVNGKQIGNHTGGYQNFSFDITNALKNGNNELVVSVYDPTDKGPNPHGKQVLRPGGIYYTPSSGIWQTVWMEIVPAAHITNINLTPDVDNGLLQLKVDATENASDYTIEAVASNGSNIKGSVGKPMLLPIPDAHLWSPDDPYLYNLNIRLFYKGKLVDTIGSYFGMRKVEIKKDEKGFDRIFLNNKYTFNLGVLDQGFWPEGLYTAPTDAALQFDIMAIRNMGYNTIRKHIKIEPARWYYHADKMGILVWQDMVTCANGSAEARAEFEKENQENLIQLHNNPSIIVWVLFNEGWARYDQQRLTEWMKKADPSRIVDGHSGENYDQGSPVQVSEKWAGSDLTDIHDYPGPGIPPALPGKARVLGEWGGIRVPTFKHQWNDIAGWGYIQLPAATFSLKYDSMLRQLKTYEEQGLSGSIYTEPFDVETEENGMMTYDREVIKIPANILRQLNSTILPQAENYAAAPNVFIAQVADTSNPEKQYAVMLQQYKQGKNNPEFLYDLAKMSGRMKDRPNATKISEEYIRQLKDPLTYTNLIFINQFTNKISDPGFSILFKNQEKAGQVLGIDEVLGKIKGIIYNEEIKPIVTPKGAKPNWDSLEKQIVTKYGAPGEEIIWRVKASYSLMKQDYMTFMATATSLVKKYGVHLSPNDLNQFAWIAFSKVSDKNSLKTALAWSKQSIQTQPEAANMDTYANLLYKLDNKQEAIQWEEKAHQMDPLNHEFEDTLKKMKNGEKTWE